MQYFVHKFSHTTHHPWPLLSVKKIVSEINHLKILEIKVVRFTKQNDHRFQRGWKQQWARSSADGEISMFLWWKCSLFARNSRRQQNVLKGDDGMWNMSPSNLVEKNTQQFTPKQQSLEVLLFFSRVSAWKTSPSVFMKTSGVPTNCTKLPANFMVWGWSIIWILDPMTKGLPWKSRGTIFDMWAFLGVVFIQGWHHVFSVHPNFQGENTSKGWEMSIASLDWKGTNMNLHQTCSFKTLA